MPEFAAHPPNLDLPDIASIPAPEIPTAAPPVAPEVKTAAGVTLETPGLKDITGEEGLKIMTDSLQLTINDIDRQISAAETWSRKRKLERIRKTYQGFLDFVNGVPVSPKTTAEFLMFAAKEAADSRADAFAILTEGKIDSSAPSRQPIDLDVDYDPDVFRSTKEMQIDFSEAAKDALVWENATHFSRVPDTFSTK